MEEQPSNLTMHRAAGSVWDRQDFEHSRARAMGMLGFALIAAGTALVGIAYNSELAAPQMSSRGSPAEAIGEAG